MTAREKFLEHARMQRERMEKESRRKKGRSKKNQERFELLHKSLYDYKSQGYISWYDALQKYNIGNSGLHGRYMRGEVRTIKCGKYRLVLEEDVKKVADDMHKNKSDRWHNARKAKQEALERKYRERDSILDYIYELIHKQKDDYAEKALDYFVELVNTANYKKGGY